MKYTGTNSTECTITVHNVTDDYNCTWAGRLDEDLTNSNIEIIVARPLENITIHVVDTLVANQPGQIKCGVFGGRPAPSISLEFTKPLPKLLNDSQTQIPGDTYIFTTVNVL